MAGYRAEDRVQAWYLGQILRKPSPAAPRLIQRGELLASLDRAAEAKVTLISGPAGSGKTSLLRAWADGPGQPYRLAVVQVRRDQQDSQQFWLAVLGAVRQASGTPGEGEQLAATPDFNQETIVGRVHSELAGHRDRTFLIIDDLHELTSPEALTQLIRLLEKLPQHVHAILATRRDLPLRLHKLRLAGELAEIRAADLRFTEHETREFLAAAGIALSEAGAAELHQRTEGWAAGLRLAAISLASSPDPERFVAEFSGSSRTVAEYLLAEMLECQPAEVQQLLLRTSLLDRVNGELADLLPVTLAPRGSCSTSRTPTRLSYRSTRPGPGSGITTSSLTCSGLSCAGGCPSNCRPCTGWPPGGSASTARSSMPSGIPRRQVTGPTRRGCCRHSFGLTLTDRLRPSRRCCEPFRRVSLPRARISLSRARPAKLPGDAWTRRPPT